MVSTPTPPDAPASKLGATIRAGTDRPSAVAAITTASAAIFVVLRLAAAAHRQIARFILAERPFVDPARAPHGLPVLAKNGYDGQFFYRLALDPANLHKTAYGITLDAPFRTQRIGYPALAWLGAVGHRPWVPAALVVINVIALAYIGFAGATFARQAGRHAAWGLLLPGFFGFVMTVSRDTAEAVAAAFLVAALLAYRGRRPLTAGLLFAIGALTRETVLVAVGALALTRLVAVATRRDKPGRDELAWVPPFLVFAVWQVVVERVTGTFPYKSDTSGRLSAPFVALFRAVRTHVGQLSPHHANVDVWVGEMVVLGAVVALGIAAVHRSTAPTHERVAFVAYLAQLVILPSTVWDDLSDLRQIDEVFLLAVIVLLAAKRTRLWKAAVLVLPALLVVAGHRIAAL